MPGPAPKSSKTRQRRNKASTRSTLEQPTGEVKVPRLPARDRGSGPWHRRVSAWWDDVWRSPMASEYLDVDRRGLEAIADLWQSFFSADSDAGRVAVHSEIRLAQRDYGLTPLDRRRLEWEIKRAEPKPTERAESKSKRARTKADPRKVLRIAT